MKTRLFLIIWFLLSISSVRNFSQPIKSFGLKLALTSANQTFGYTYLSDIDTKRFLGTNAGLFLEWIDNSAFSIVSQLEYAQKGMKIEYAITGPTGPEPTGFSEEKNRVDYLSFSILGKIALQTNTINPYIFAGPRIDFLLGNNSAYYKPVYDNFKKNTWGGSVGIGSELKAISNITLLIEARYNFDLSDSYKTDLLKIQNNSFDFWIGVAI